MASDGFGKGSSGSSYLSVQHETVCALPCYRQLKKKKKDMTSFSHLYKAQLFSTCSHLPCLTASLSIYQLRLTDHILFVLIEQFEHTLSLAVWSKSF